MEDHKQTQIPLVENICRQMKSVEGRR